MKRDFVALVCGRNVNKNETCYVTIASRWVLQINRVRVMESVDDMSTSTSGHMANDLGMNHVLGGSGRAVKTELHLLKYNVNSTL